MLILNSTIANSNSKFCPETLKNDNCFLNSVPKIPGGNFCDETSKFYVLNETQYNEIFKSVISGYCFSLRFFFISNISEPHCCLFLA